MWNLLNLWHNLPNDQRHVLPSKWKILFMDKAPEQRFQFIARLQPVKRNLLEEYVLGKIAHLPVVYAFVLNKLLL